MKRNCIKIIHPYPYTVGYQMFQKSIMCFSSVFRLFFSIITDTETNHWILLGIYLRESRPELLLNSDILGVYCYNDRDEFIRDNILLYEDFNYDSSGISGRNKSIRMIQTKKKKIKREYSVQLIKRLLALDQLIHHCGNLRQRHPHLLH